MKDGKRSDSCGISDCSGLSTVPESYESGRQVERAETGEEMYFSTESATIVPSS